MANNLNYNDKQNVDAALLEYEKDVKVDGKFKIGTKNDEYIGNVAHIYDNVNGHEEQVFVLTNNGQGTKQKQFLMMPPMKHVLKFKMLRF